MNHWSKRAAGGICCVILAAGIFSGCGQTEEPLLDSRVMVEVQEAAYGSISTEGKYIGKVTAAETVQVVPMVSGTVTSLNVKVGQKVTAGEILCKLDDSSARIDLASAKAGYDTAVHNASSSTGSSWNLARAQENDSLRTIGDNLDSVEERLSDSRREQRNLQSSLEAALQVMNEAQTAYEEAKKALEDYQAAAGGGGNPGNGEPEDDTGDADGETPPAGEGDSGSGSTLEELTRDLALKQAAAADAAEKYASIQAALSAQASQTTSLEDQEDTLEDSYRRAARIRNINDNEVYQDRVTAANDAIESARIGVESAEHRLSLYTLTAPISGVVDQVSVEENNFASSGTVAFQIAADEEKLVTWYVTEEVRDELWEGQPVRVEYNGREYDGSIWEIGTAVDMTHGLFRVRAVMDGMETVSNGVSVEVAVTNHRAENCIILPFDAVYYENGIPYVYVMENGLAVKTAVTQGITTTQFTAIEGGLKPGQLVITSWSANLRDGAEVLRKGEIPEETGVAE